MGASFKKFISVLCVLSLLIGLVPGAAFAAPAGTAAERAAEVVSGTVKTESGEPAADRGGSFSPKTSGEEVEISTWKELMYRLQYYAKSGEVIKLTGDIRGSNALMLLRDVQVTLDLNGHKIEKITATAGNDECAIIIVTGSLTITDSNPNTTHEGGTITGGIITGGNCTGNGGGICVNGGSLTLAGGVITGNEAQYGGGVYVNSGCGFTMTGGVITGNEAQYGGGVYICGGASFEGTGGRLAMSGGSIVSNIGQQCGGGVYIAGGSNHFAGGGSFTMSGGTVSENISKNGGGVYAVGGIVSHYNAGDGSFTMSGGSVTDNTAQYGGGGVYLDGGGFTMSDGSVTGNNSDKEGEYGCVVCALNNADVRLSGGTISGNKDYYAPQGKTESFVYFDRSSSLTLAGASTLTVTDCIRLNANQSIKVASPLAAGSKVHVYINTTETPQSGKPIIIAESEEDCTVSFEIEHQPAGSELIYEFGRLILRKTCNIKTWADLQSAMNSGGDWENGTGQIIRLGYDITAGSENTALVFGNFTARPVTLELDGHKINRALTQAAENGNVLTVNGGTLIIRDSQGGGSITGGNNVSNGGGIVVNGDGVNVGGGRLTLESGSISGNSSDSNGGGVCVNGGSLTMAGGSISGNSSDSNGGGVYVGGSIGDNTGSDGDSVDVGGGSFTLSGGSITGNTARSNGEGIYLDADSYLTLSGGSVLNTDEVYLPTGKSIGIGSAPADLSHVVVKVQDSATRANPVVIAISATDCRTVFEINNQQPNTELVYEDEEIKLRLTSAATSWADLQNALDNGGTASGTEHIIRLTEDITAGNDEQALEFHYTEHPVILDLNGHSINRALTQAAENGNVLTVNGGDLTIRDNSANKTGSITGGKTMTNGGGVVVSGGSLTLAGGSIRGNSSDSNGGGVYVGGGRFTLAGGSVTGNTANGNGSIYVKNNAKLTLSGGSIAANAGSATIYPETGSNITLTSGSVLSVADSILLPVGTSVNVASAPEKGSAVRVRVLDTVTAEHPVTIAQSAVDCRACLEIEDQQENTELVFEDNAVKLKKKQAAPVTSWEGLQTALTNGGEEESGVFVIRLGNDIAAQNSDTALLFEYTAHPVILDLNGHAIDRALTQEAADGNVLTVNGGTLILRDSQGGSIKGGYNNAPGSGVRVLGGTFTMEDGSITENRTGGVYVATGGVFKLQGGSITGNSTDSNGGGVYVDGGSFLVSGSPTVTGNTDSTQNRSNVYLNTGSVIALDGQLTNGASFGVGAAYEGRFTDDSYDRYTHIDNPFTADNLYRLYQDDGWPCIESIDHHPAAPEWTWADDLTAATAKLVCQNCGETIWSEETNSVSFTYDEEADKLFARAEVNHDGTDYQGRLELHPLRVEERQPRIDEDKVYHSGTKAHYKLNVVNAEYYFTEVDGHPGLQCTEESLRLDTFKFVQQGANRGIAAYTGGFDAVETYIELPGAIENPENPDDPFTAFELRFLGDGVNPFYTLPKTMQAAPPKVVITDKGTITSVSAAAFAGKQKLVLQLETDNPITIADGAFTDCVDVKIQANSTSGLEAKTYNDSTGKYTVEHVDRIQYNEAATWAEDYSSAEITITDETGTITHDFPATNITRTETETEDPQTHEKTYTMSITAEGTFEGNTYSVTLHNVPCYSVTVKGTGVLNLPRKVKTDGTYEDYAVFKVTQALLDPLAVNPPAGAELAGLKDDSGNDHVVNERVEITQDTTFMASWRSTWAKVQAALSAGGAPQVTLYSDISPAQGDSYLHVPQGVTATLNLGGYKVNRGLSQSSPIPDGYVIRVDGSLTLKNGTVTGGSNTGDGGGIYLFNGGSLITNNVTVSINHAQNGGGVYMVDVSQAEFNNSTISYNVANQYGGGLYVGGERPSSNSGLLGDPSGSSNAILSNVSIIHNSAQNAGGLFVNSGEVQLGSNTKIINNTNLDGTKFNNIDVVGGIMDLISGAEGLLLGLPAAAGSVSSLKGWALALLGALAVGGTIAAVIVLDRDKKSPGDDQEKECQPHILRIELKWANDYSSVTEYVRCSECGKILEINDLPLSVTIDDKMNTHYKVKPSQQTADDERIVPPYKLVKQANIPAAIDTTDTAGDFIDDVELIPHGKGEPKTVVLGPSRWQFVENGDKLLFDGWLCNNARVAQVTFTGPDNQTITVQVHWLLPYGYAPHDSVPHDPVVDPAQGSHPLTPDTNPKYVESGAQETVKENQWTRLLYKFTAWRVPLPVKIVKEGLRYKLVYTYVEIDSSEIDDKKKPGDPLKITGPVILRAEWQSKWKHLAETLKKERAFAMTEYVTATLTDDTIKIEGNSESVLALNGMMLKAGEDAPKVQSVLNVVGILAITDPLSTGMIMGGHTTTNGGGITIGSDGTLTLQGGNIVSNEAQMLNEKTGNGGGVSVSGNFIMSGGSVKNNTADGNGGGVYIADKAAFAMSGGEISGNNAGGHAGGVYVGGSFSVAGKVIIKDNTVGVNASNVYLPTGKTITVSGKLDDAAEIHVSMQTPGVITFGLNAKGGNQANGKAANFVSDDADYRVIINDDGEAELVQDKPIFGDARLELGGILRMRFYMDYPEGWDRSSDRMVFELNKTEDRTVPYNAAATGDGKDFFACPVNAYQMADTITATYYHGSEKIAEKQYSVEMYLKSLADSTEESAATRNLARATMNYGSYIQPYLAKANGWIVGTDYARMEPYNTITTGDNPATAFDFSFKRNMENYSNFVKKTEFYLALDSDTVLNARVYLKDGTTQTLTGTANGEVVSPWPRSGNSWVLSYGGLGANALNTKIRFTCSVIEEESELPLFTMEVSPLSFVNIVLRNGASSPEEDLALHALYNYWDAANNYPS